MKKLNHGLLTLLLTLALAGVAYATVGQKPATLDYTDIKISLNGTEIVPKDVNGNAVEPFAIEGTTYLPVRAVADALGLEVGWDQDTKTVILSTKSDSEDALPSDTLIMDSNGVQVYYRGISDVPKGLKGKNINVRIINSREDNVMVQVRDLSVNGVMVDSIFSAEVAAGKTAFDEILIMQTSLEKAGITSMDHAEFKLHVFNADTWDTIYDSDPIVVK